MQTIVHIKDTKWSNLLVIAFLLGLAAFAPWLDRHSHGSVSVPVWLFSGFFVLFCFVFLGDIRSPKSLLLAFDGPDLYWRIREEKSGRLRLEKRLPLRSISALKWIVPVPVGSKTGQDYANARLLFITAGRQSHALPSEFTPAAHRRKIEDEFKRKLPNIQIVEKLESQQ